VIIIIVNSNKELVMKKDDQYPKGKSPIKFKPTLAAIQERIFNGDQYPAFEQQAKFASTLPMIQEEASEESRPVRGAHTKRLQRQRQKAKNPKQR